MELRFMNHDTKETSNCNFLDVCSLDDLRRWLNPSSPSSVHISLNRKDELVEPSTEHTLRSLGLISGDLLYYSLTPSAFSISPEFASEEEVQSNPVRASEGGAENSGELKTLVRELRTNRESERGSTNTRHGELRGVPQNHNVDMDIDEERNFDLNLVGDESVEISTDNTNGELRGVPENHYMNMDIEKKPEFDLNVGPTESSDGREDSDSMDMEFERVDYARAKKLSEPFLLKKVILEECTDTSELTMMVMAVHAIMLESDFVLMESDSTHRTKQFSFSKETMSCVTLTYSLPELIIHGESNTNGSVSLKFQSLGYMLVVYGSLNGTNSTYKMYLDSRRFVPIIDLVMNTLKSNKEGCLSRYNEVLELWRMVKDRITIPLLIGLCDKTGLDLPPCLMSLPTELKMRIMESLTGVDIAKVACVCSEMRNVSTNEQLWEKKCVEDFGELMRTREDDLISWKGHYGALWESCKRIYDMEDWIMWQRFEGYPNPFEVALFERDWLPDLTLGLGQR